MSSTNPTPKKSRRWKRFTHDQIRAKIDQRRDLKCYRKLLMEAAVDKDERGIVFDSQHPSWKKLISLVVTQVSEKERQFRDELKKPTPDMYVIKQFCRRNGIPPSLRGKIWMLLLRESTTKPLPIGDFTKLLPTGDPGLRVIKADISRTFPYNEMFQKQSVQKELETLLSTYCREYNVQYKQGMNFIFAIFFQIGLETSAERYCAASLFMEGLMGSTFKDTDFSGLQSVFRVFRLLMLYHDPVLCNFLDQHDMVPELYASSWFITLHANRVKINNLLYLWDLLLLEHKEDPLLHYFVSLALLISHKPALLKESMVTLPEKLSRLAIQSKSEVLDHVSRARRKLRPDTPQTVRTLLESIAGRINSVASPEYQRLESMHCATVTAEEVVRNCYLDRKRSFSSVKFFVLDCRPADQYRAGHLACAYHLDPDLLFQPEKLNDAARSLSAMKGCHFCFCSDLPAPSRNDSSCTMFILFLLQKGFKFISRCEGGYAACHAIVATNSDYDMVDHDPDACIECLKKRSGHSREAKAGGKSRRLLGMLQNRLTDMLFGGTNSKQQSTSPNEATSPQSPSGTPIEPSGSILPVPSQVGQVAAEFQAAVAGGSVAVLPASMQLQVLLATLKRAEAFAPGLWLSLGHLTGILTGMAVDQHLTASSAFLEALERPYRGEVSDKSSRKGFPRVFGAAIKGYDAELLEGVLAGFSLLREGGEQVVILESKGRGEAKGSTSVSPSLARSVLPRTIGESTLVVLYCSFATDEDQLLYALTKISSREATSICLITLTISQSIATALLKMFPSLKIITATSCATSETNEVLPARLEKMLSDPKQQRSRLKR